MNMKCPWYWTLDKYLQGIKITEPPEPYPFTEFL